MPRRSASARSPRFCKVHVEGYPDFWAITTHADVMEVERNPEVFTNAPYPTVTPSSTCGRGD